MNRPGLRAREAILKRDKYTCRACGARGRMVTLEVDHIVPVARDGTNSEINLQTLCRPCNAKKAATYIEDQAA